MGNLEILGSMLCRGGYCKHECGSDSFFNFECIIKVWGARSFGLELSDFARTVSKIIFHHRLYGLKYTLKKIQI